MQVKEPLIVTIDSSGPTLAVGVKKGAQLYTARRSGLKQEQFFLALLQRVLDKAGSGLADIKRLFFVRGPGRFTGIRISLTFASMLQSLNGTKVGSATAFEILHEQVQQSASFRRWQRQHPQGTVAVVLHAFREEYFLQFFDAAAQGPQWLSKEELLAKLAARQEPLYIAGTDKDNTPLAALLGTRYCLAPATDCRVQMKTLAAMSSNALYEKNALEPLYLKPARFELN